MSHKFNPHPIVPAAPFQELVTKYMAENGCSPLEVELRAGIARRNLYRIMHQKNISFNSADRLVTYLWGAMLWWDRDDLREIYLSADLSDGTRPKEKPPRPVYEPAHGTRARYRKGCKCGDCVSFVSQYMKEMRMRRKASGNPIKRVKKVGA